MNATAEEHIDPNEPRLFEETGIDARIAALILPVIQPMGFRLVRVRLSGMNGLTLQVMAERFDGSMTIEDCELISKTISPVLDVEDIIERNYNLEVSSAGIDRPLVRKSDFVKWQGHIAKVETSVAVEGKRKFRGRIDQVDENGFTIEIDQVSYGMPASVRVEFNNLSDARLILTDALIQDAFKKDKALRRQLDDGEQTTDES